MSVDFAQRPMLVFWETTRACPLACRHCRASATLEPLPNELTAAEGHDLIEQVAGLRAGTYLFLAVSAVALLIRPLRRRWIVRAGIGILLGALVGWFLVVWADVTKAFELPMPPDVKWWTTGGFALLGLSIVGHLDRQTTLMLEAPAPTDDLPQPERMRCT